MAEYIKKIEVTFTATLQSEAFEVVKGEDDLQNQLDTLLSTSTNPHLSDVEISDLTIVEQEDVDEDEDEDEDDEAY